MGNPDVLYSTPWKHIVQNDFWGTPLTDSGSHGSYRPLCVLSFKLNHLFDGFKPFGYHLVNVLLHCLATGLVVKVARHVLQSKIGTIVTGALFASHPIHTEAVAGVNTNVIECAMNCIQKLYIIENLCVFNFKYLQLN